MLYILIFLTLEKVEDLAGIHLQSYWKKDPCSINHNVVRCYAEMINQSGYINEVIL